MDKKDELFNTVNPREFLTYRQNNRAPTSIEEELINQIINETHLDYPVINVLLDYVLIKKENTLPKKYTMTLATNLRNNNITTVRDARAYLKNKDLYLRSVSKKQEENKDAVRESNTSLEQALAEFKLMQESFDEEVK